MKRKQFVCWWRGADKMQYVVLPCTRHEVNENIVEVYDMDMMIGAFDMGFIELWYVRDDV